MSESSERAWFRWSNLHPILAQDPRAAFAAGWRLCNEQLLDSSAQWVQLAPLLASLLEEIVILRETREIEDGVASPAPSMQADDASGAFTGASSVSAGRMF